MLLAFIDPCYQVNIIGDFVWESCFSGYKTYMIDALPAQPPF